MATRKVYTFAEAKQKIVDEMDLGDETFVSDQEYYDYFNEAINEAEAEIHNQNEDYFLASETLPLVASTATYSLPDSIYANKIRHIQFKQSDNTRIYEIRRVPIERIMYINETNSSNMDYCYHLVNNAATGTQLVLHPTPQASDSTSVSIYFLRNATRVEATTDEIDIPEFIEFTFAFVRVKIARKEMSPLLGSYEESLERQRQLMKETLCDMIPDSDATISPDMSFYSDFDDLDFVW